MCWWSWVGVEGSISRPLQLYVLSYTEGLGTRPSSQLIPWIAVLFQLHVVLRFCEFVNYTFCKGWLMQTVQCKPEIRNLNNMFAWVVPWRTCNACSCCKKPTLQGNVHDVQTKLQSMYNICLLMLTFMTDVYTVTTLHMHIATITHASTFIGANLSASDSAHDFMYSHSSCLLRLTPTMFYLRLRSTALKAVGIVNFLL